jgi:FtsZ-binding cell division protein ZapB
MSEDHIQKVLLETIDMLRRHIQDLKEENRELKRCILKTIGKLQKENASTQKHLDNINNVARPDDNDDEDRK